MTGGYHARIVAFVRFNSNVKAQLFRCFLSFYVAGFHTAPFSISRFPTATPPLMSGDLSASVAPRSGAFVLANMADCMIQ